MTSIRVCKFQAEVHQVRQRKEISLATVYGTIRKNTNNETRSKSFFHRNATILQIDFPFQLDAYRQRLFTIFCNNIGF